MQREREGSGCGDECRNAGSGLENWNQAFVGKEKARRKKCEVRFSLIRKNRVFKKTYMRTGVRKLPRTGGLGSCESVGRARKLEAQVEETNGSSSSRQEGIGFAFTLHGSE